MKTSMSPIQGWPDPGHPHKQAEAAIPIPDLHPERGMCVAAFYKWRTKFGGMDPAS